MRIYHKILLNLIIAAVFFILLYVLQTTESNRDNNIFANFKNASSAVAERRDVFNRTRNYSQGGSSAVEMPFEKNNESSEVYNVWCIFTKVTSHAPMKKKFQTFLHSLLEHSTGHIALHVITDNSSRPISNEVLENVKEATHKMNIMVTYYDVGQLAEELQDIVSAMQPHFSSQPGTYYSDALFFLSLGLHRIALGQQRAAMFDADTKLRADVEELFKEFDRFGPDTLFGLAPELTPVYRHVLYLYRSRHKHTRFGEPLSSHNGQGFPGLNSGVILFRLDRMRQSLEYNQLLDAKAVTSLANKYSFKGHLGDQDFYTLLAMEHPHLVQLLPCTWNRQLCTWWRDHGYRDVFDAFAYCNGDVKLYHGNCNTPIPNN